MELFLGQCPRQIKLSALTTDYCRQTDDGESICVSVCSIEKNVYDWANNEPVMESESEMSYGVWFGHDFE